jgi:hypothetical protein
MEEIRIYLWESASLSFKSWGRLWSVVAGLLGTSFAGIVVILRGAISFVDGSSANAQAINGILSTVVFAIGAFVLIFSLWTIVVSPFQLWRSERRARLKIEALFCHPFVNIERSSLFFAPPHYESWTARLVCKKNDSVQICLKLSAHSGGSGYNFWNPEQILVLNDSCKFVKDSEVSIDLIELDKSGPTPSWRWAAKTDGGERPLVLSTFHRCQLVFIGTDQKPMDHFDFVMTFHDGTPDGRKLYGAKIPSLVGEHLFLYAREWKDVETAK